MVIFTKIIIIFQKLFSQCRGDNLKFISFLYNRKNSKARGYRPTLAETVCADMKLLAAERSRDGTFNKRARAPFRARDLERGVIQGIKILSSPST